MANKVIIGILIILVVLYSGLGYYSYTLNQQLTLLQSQLNTIRTEQNTRTDNLSTELTILREDVIAGIGQLESSIEENQVQMNILGNETGENSAKLESLEDKTSEILTGIAILEGEINSIAEFSLPVLDAAQVYEMTSQATIRISNGEDVVGSGFIYDTEVHVVTAYHVVESLSQIYVILPDGRVSKATTIGSSLYSDVAVLKLDDKLDIKPITLADSAKIQVVARSWKTHSGGYVRRSDSQKNSTSIENGVRRPVGCVVSRALG